MKKIIVIICSLSTSILFSQDIIKESDVMKSNASKLRGEFEILELNDGTMIKVGDTLKIFRPSNDSKDNFKYLMYGTGGGSMLKGIRYVNTEMYDQNVIITKLKFTSNIAGTAVVAQLDPINQIGLDKYITVTNILNAVNLKELKVSNRSLTKDEAIKLLEEKKKLMELDLITPEEYEYEKDKLKSFILK